jgi:hypothetical protein
MEVDKYYVKINYLTLLLALNPYGWAYALFEKTNSLTAWGCRPEVKPFEYKKLEKETKIEEGKLEPQKDSLELIN